MNRIFFICLAFLILIPLSKVSAQNETANETANMTNATNVTRPPKPSVWVWGNVVDIVWRPSWHEESFLGKCDFTPIIDEELNKSLYLMECTWDWNFTKDEGTVELFRQLMQLNQVDEMKEQAEEIGKLKTRSFILTLMIIIMIIGVVIYFVHDWIYSRSLKRSAV